MAKPTADKTKPESVMTITIEEVHYVPGTNEFTLSARSDDADVKTIRKLVDMQSYIDGLSGTVVTAINDFFKEIAASALEVTTGDISGDFISQTP